MPLIHDDNRLILQISPNRYEVIALTGLFYFLAAVYCIYISRQPGSIAAIWYANAIVIVALQGLSYRDWGIVLPLIGVCNLAANAVFNDSWLFSLSFLPGNLLEMGLSGYLIRRFISLKTAPQDPVMLLKMFGLTFPPLVISGLLGASILSLQGTSSFYESWFLLCMGSATGIISILPLGILVVANGWKALTQVANFFNFFITILIAILTALCSFVYLPDPYVYISATLLVVALIGRFTGTAIAVFTYSVIIGGLISFGFFTATMQGRYINSESLLFMPLIMTLLQPLLLAAAVERMNYNKPWW